MEYIIPYFDSYVTIFCDFSENLIPLKKWLINQVSCPLPTDRAKSKNALDICCCSVNCCWDKCTFSTPPSDCLKNVTNSQWIYSQKLGYFQAFHNPTEGKEYHKGLFFLDAIHNFISRTIQHKGIQQWRLKNNRLENKKHGLFEGTNWRFHDGKVIRSIKTSIQSMVFGVVGDGTTAGDQVKFKPYNGQLWERKIWNETYFTLEVLGLSLTESSIGVFVKRECRYNVLAYYRGR